VGHRGRPEVCVAEIIRDEHKWFLQDRIITKHFPAVATWIEDRSSRRNANLLTVLRSMRVPPALRIRVEAA